MQSSLWCKALTQPDDIVVKGDRAAGVFIAFPSSADTIRLTTRECNSRSVWDDAERLVETVRSAVMHFNIRGLFELGYLRGCGVSPCLGDDAA
jgi:hypothetical protein